ncbi:MAG: hypothetical protein HPY64_11705 [Anaerolineae bacterium]|nr:hypothetical protein [Anaerolineae bacterium]
MSGENWHSLYIPTGEREAQDVARTLREALIACGYQPYDPFPGGSGLSAVGWTERVRHFVAPVRQGWMRVLGQPDRQALPLLAATLGGPLLHAWLEGEAGGVTVWTAEGANESAAALEPWRRADCPAEALARALNGSLEAADAPLEPDIPLPAEMQALARSVDPAQARRLIDRLTRTVFDKLGGADPAIRAGAMALLPGGPAWASAGGRRLQAVMACLCVPQDWRWPDERDLLAAYQVARARQHRPDGLRLPGDDEALARLPEALDYLPVYAGRR